MLNAILVIQSLRLDILSQQISFEEVNKLSPAISSMVSCADTKHLIQFLERLALSFGNEEQNAEETDQVPDSIPRECSLRLEGFEERGPCDGENEVKEPCRGCRQRHSLGSDIKGIGFGGICERDWAFSWRVDDSEKVDSESYACNAGC